LGAGVGKEESTAQRRVGSDKRDLQSRNSELQRPKKNATSPLLEWLLFGAVGSFPRGTRSLDGSFCSSEKTDAG
jgi:hypothetical protein